MNRIWADIEPLVQQESSRQNHYYLGVEHLFIALLNLENSLVARLLRETNVDPALVIYLIRETLGQTIDRRYWNGYRPTPRYLSVLLKAQQYAAVPTERELFIAMLAEGDSVPIRVLIELGVDPIALRHAFENNEAGQPSPLPALTSTLPLTRLEQGLIQRLYREYKQIEVVSELGVNAGSARFYIVKAEDIEYISLVKIDLAEMILREYRKFRNFVLEILPQDSVDIIGIPVLAEEANLAALRYDVAGAAALQNFLTFARENGGKAASKLLLDGVYAGHPGGWWSQASLHQFELWREYEYLFPPVLVIEVDVEERTGAQVLEPLGDWGLNSNIRHGDMVEMRDFTVLKVLPARGVLVLSAGYGDDAVNMASQVEVLGLSKVALATCYIGQSVRSVYGRVLRTREDVMTESVYQLLPTFDMRADEFPTPIGALPNPVAALPRMLRHGVKGYFSTIHGDLSIEDIAVNPELRAYLLNFASARYGHVMADWALFEVSLLRDLVSEAIEDDWESVWELGKFFHVLSSPAFVDQNYDIPYQDFLVVVAVVRQVVGSLLADPDDWSEYLAVLGIIAFANSFSGRVAVRRILFVWSALSFHMVGFLAGKTS